MPDSSRAAVISDIHGNLPALEAVLADVRRAGIDVVWCLGDLVGYGAQPNECVALAAEACDVCLVGNHDLVVLDRLDIATFSPNAAVAARWTRSELGEDARGFLNGLSASNINQPIGLFHGSPRDPVWEYVLSPGLAAECIDAMVTRVGAVGHSHVALCFRSEERGEAGGGPAAAGAEVSIADGGWLLNPGSVGQPRDGDARAAWLEIDLDDWKATWRRSEYAVDEAAEAIREAGLPAALADRLYYGQ